MFHRALAFTQRIGGLLNHRVQRQIVDLIQRFHQSLLNLCQTAAHRRDDLITVKLANAGNRRLFWIEVQIDIQRPGHQVPGFQRAA
ncbi:hypothetical protein SDC9_188551 [bioreactor metagenome]|uniref:Uncharacterized protein n=1 Tax=bioreactor metagenome TaxID=1076179 RepID=A0A645HPN1_9ZZZZ